MLDILEANEPSDIDYLVEFSDDVESYIVGSRSDWLHFLRSSIGGSNLTIFIILLDDEVRGYMVILNSLVWPLSNSLFIQYAYSTLPVKESRDVFGKIIEWAKIRGASSISISTKPELEKYMQSIGFISKEQIEMEMVI
jgi:hypothetical protein